MTAQLFVGLAACCVLAESVLGFNPTLFGTPSRNLLLQTSRIAPPLTYLRPTRSARCALRMQTPETERDTARSEVGAKQPYAETQKALVRRYEDFLDWKSDTNGFEMQEWRVDNRVLKMESQNITKETAPDRAMEAILRTRQKYVSAFMDDGVNMTAAETRADDFLEDTARSLEIIWKDEKERFVNAEEDAEKRSKLLVVLANIFIFTPLVLAFLSTMPIGPVFEMAQFYITNNCNAVGGIKCNGEGAQGQKLPNIQKMFTPPKKIVRKSTSFANRIEEPTPAPAGDAVPSQ